MTRRMNRRVLWELSPQESQPFDRRCGEYLARLEAEHERKARIRISNEMAGIDGQEVYHSDGLRQATNGRVKFCLRHDPTISAEFREKNHIPFEELPQKGTDNAKNQ